MTETELAALCAAITPPDEAARAAAHAHWASLAKPLMCIRDSPRGRRRPHRQRKAGYFPPGGAGALRR